MGLEIPRRNLTEYKNTLYRKKLEIFWNLKKLETEKILGIIPEDIKKINDKIKIELEKAKKLEMQKTPLKVCFKKNYKVDIREYIQELLKKF